MSLRGFALILVLINLGLAVFWILQPKPRAETLPPVTDSGIPPLTLLSEFDARQGISESVHNRVEPGQQDTLACYSLGPYATRSEARRALGVIRNDVERARIRQSEAMQTLGYWIYLPAVSTRAEALALARQLSELGVRDYYVVTAGERMNTVSLGLFSVKENATRRLEGMKQLGFDARMTIRKEKRPVYFVDYAHHPAQEPDWESALRGDPNKTRTPAPCF